MTDEIYTVQKTGRRADRSNSRYMPPKRSCTHSPTLFLSHTHEHTRAYSGSTNTSAPGCEPIKRVWRLEATYEVTEYCRGEGYEQLLRSQPPPQQKPSPLSVQACGYIVGGTRGMCTASRIPSLAGLSGLSQETRGTSPIRPESGGLLSERVIPLRESSSWKKDRPHNGRVECCGEAAFLQVEAQICALVQKCGGSGISR